MKVTFTHPLGATIDPEDGRPVIKSAGLDVSLIKRGVAPEAVYRNILDEWRAVEKRRTGVEPQDSWLPPADLHATVRDTAEGYTASIGSVTLRWRETWADGSCPDHVMSISTEGISCTAPTREEAVRQLSQRFQELLFEPIRLATREK